MKWFSQRKKLKKARAEIQVDYIDDALRNRLWNVLLAHYLTHMVQKAGYFLPRMQSFMVRFWDEYLKYPVSNMPRDSPSIFSAIHKHFFECKWYEVYDFLELIVAYHPTEEIKEAFMRACDDVLEKELSAYRFVERRITQMTSEEEISEIEEALETPFGTVNAHIREALKLMSDRKSPDHRNSIKESISAVEAICRIIAQDEKATLGKALDIIEEKIGLHGALKRAFDSLYGYTSSAEGIRHALLDKKINLSFEDAKFMLVSCSAFINYLISKASKTGINIGK